MTSANIQVHHLAFGAYFLWELYGWPPYLLGWIFRITTYFFMKDVLSLTDDNFYCIDYQECISDMVYIWWSVFSLEGE